MNQIFRIAGIAIIFFLSACETKKKYELKTESNNGYSYEYGTLDWKKESIRMDSIEHMLI